MTDQTASPPFQIQIVPVTPFQQNCSIVRARSGKAAIVDPGGEPDRLMEAAEKIGATIEKIWLTHGHLDHAGAAEEIKRRTGAIIEGPAEPETYWLSRVRESWEKMGWTGGEDVTPDRWLTDGDELELDGNVFKVVTTPGHTPGHVVIYSETARLAFVGDVIFKGSVGRTDFPKSVHEDLIASITQKLWPLGDDMAFIPGHGPMSTFGAERQTNPFVADRVLAGR